MESSNIDTEIDTELIKRGSYPHIISCARTGNQICMLCAVYILNENMYQRCCDHMLCHSLRALNTFCSLLQSARDYLFQFAMIWMQHIYLTRETICHTVAQYHGNAIDYQIIIVVQL